MLAAPGRLLRRPFSVCLAPHGELGFIVDVIGPGPEAIAAGEPGGEVAVFGPLGNGYRLEVESRCSSAGASASRRCRTWPSNSAARRASLPASAPDAHAEAASILLPHTEVVVDPRLVTQCYLEGWDVLACGPEPMLHAVAAFCPTAQLAWEAPMACGYGACYGCVVEIDGALQRLCVEGPVLDASQVAQRIESASNTVLQGTEASA